MQTSAQTTPEQKEIFDQLEKLVKNGDVTATRLSEHIEKLKRKRRRPQTILSANEIRNKVIAVRLNLIEKRLVNKLAKAEKKPASELIREWLMKRAAEKGIE